MAEKKGPTFGYIYRREGIGSGLPCVVGTGVRADIIAGHFVAGDSIRTLSEDFNLSEAAIIDAIRLVAATAFGRQGLRADAERSMLERVASHTEERG